MTSSIKSIYRKLDCDRVHQGDILKNFQIPFIKDDCSKEINVKVTNPLFSIILSQDCDIDGINLLNKSMNAKDKIINGNKFLPSVIIAPLYEASKINQGTYLSHLGFKMDEKGNEKKTKWKNIISNENPRYHYLEKIIDEGEGMIMDFKIFYSVPYDYIFSRYEGCYFMSLNELFRENLSARFFNYHSRIGLPPTKDNL